MGKNFKLVATAGIALTAITPAVVFANETPTQAATGFYTADTYTTPVEYKNLSLQEKRQLLNKEDLVFVVSGFVYFAKEALGKSDADLEKIAMSVAEFQDKYGELTDSGYAEEAATFSVLSIE